jgi:tetratricopeptide (TPR) repeat protein
MTAQTACPPEPVLRAFHDGALADPDLDAVTAHLESCPSCEQALSRIEADPTSLQANFRALRSQMLVETPRDTAADAPRAPTRCGRYELRERLGYGGMGVVYLGRDPELKRFAAVKLLRAGLAAGPGELARFQREAELLARLRHPNLVPVYEAGEQDGQPYLAMEYVSGGSLADRLRAGPLEPPAAAGLVLAVARAAQAAHLCGIVHRDIKPANILLSGVRGQETGVSEDRILTPVSCLLTPMLSDFGLARPTDPDGGLTETGMAAGTPGYMAPEQADPRVGAVGPGADVWALGAVLYECLTGRPPFAGGSAAEVLRRLLDEEPVPPTRTDGRVPRDLGVICLKCLRKAPADRYPTAGELADDLDRFLAGEPIRARPVSAAEAVWKWARRRPDLAGLAAVSLLLLITGFALVTWKWRDAVRARDAAGYERGQAVIAQAEAERQRKEADDHYRLARQAVDRYFARVSANQQLQGFTSLRNRLLQDAGSMYEVLAAARPADPALAADRARAITLLGDIARETGKTDVAAARYQEASDAQEALLAARPGDPDLTRDLAATLISRGHLASRKLEREEAIDWFDRARRLAEPLARDHPDRPEFRDCLATACFHLGRERSFTGRTADAVRALEQARAERDALAAADPGSPEAALTLAMTDTALGEALQYRRNAADAARAAAAFERAGQVLGRLPAGLADDPEFRDAVLAVARGWTTLHKNNPVPPEARVRHHHLRRQLFERLWSEAPTVTSYLYELLFSYDYLGRADLIDGRVVEALGWAEKGVNAGRGKAPRGAFSGFHVVVSSLERTRADALTRLGRHREALGAWDAAIGLTPAGIQQDDARLGRSVSLAALGFVDAAVREVNSLSRAGTVNPYLYFRAAQTMAVAAAGVSATDPPRAREFADRAVGFLARAEAAGCFLVGQTAQDLVANAFLHPVRWRPEVIRMMVAARPPARP